MGENLVIGEDIAAFGRGPVTESRAMTLPSRMTLLALSGLLVLAIGLLMPRSPAEVAVSEASADLPPLHMSVPTAPYAPAN